MNNKYCKFIFRYIVKNLYIVGSMLKGLRQKGYLCPICKSESTYFKPYGTSKIRMNAECPLCRAAERDRAQSIFLKMELQEERLNNKRILHFAPEDCMYKYFWFANKEKFEQYIAVDIDINMPHIDKAEDITNLTFSDNLFDVIICNQVLEHVKMDDKAISEISRVLNKDGYAIITVPIDEKKPTLCEDWINTNELRIKYYGETNHVRMYGNDFCIKLYKNGLEAERVYAHQLIDKQLLTKYGLKEEEYFWICKKIEK